MSTITVFVADTEEEERRRRRAKRLAAVIILGLAGVFGFSQEDTPNATPSPVAIAPVKPHRSESLDSDHYGTAIGPLPGPRAIVARPRPSTSASAPSRASVRRNS